MDVTSTAPIALAERRLAWLEARQRVLSANIANADTPRYQPRDLPAFAKLMTQQAGLALRQTDPGHLPPVRGPMQPRVAREGLDTSPNGNSVSLDQEALKVAETDTAHALATGLRKSWLGMFGTALGKQQ
jgi:flagellar basal-body rod protein FlgB